MLTTVDMLMCVLSMRKEGGTNGPLANFSHRMGNDDRLG